TVVATGKGLEKLRHGIRLQRGDERVVDEPQRLPQARFHTDVVSSTAGYVRIANCEQLGTALAMLGGGREKKEDKIDHAVGLEFHKRIGDSVEKGEKLVTIYYNSDAKLAEAKTLIAGSYVSGQSAPSEKRVLIRSIIGA